MREITQMIETVETKTTEYDVGIKNIILVEKIETINGKDFTSYRLDAVNVPESIKERITVSYIPNFDSSKHFTEIFDDCVQVTSDNLNLVSEDNIYILYSYNHLIFNTEYKLVPTTNTFDYSNSSLYLKPNDR